MKEKREKREEKGEKRRGKERKREEKGGRMKNKRIFSVFKVNKFLITQRLFYSTSFIYIYNLWPSKINIYYAFYTGEILNTFAHIFNYFE